MAETRRLDEISLIRVKTMRELVTAVMISLVLITYSQIAYKLALAFRSYAHWPIPIKMPVRYITQLVPSGLVAWLIAMSDLLFGVHRQSGGVVPLPTLVLYFSAGLATFAGLEARHQIRKRSLLRAFRWRISNHELDPTALATIIPPIYFVSDWERRYESCVFQSVTNLARDIQHFNSQYPGYRSSSNALVLDGMGRRLFVRVEWNRVIQCYLEESDPRIEDIESLEKRGLAEMSLRAMLDNAGKNNL